MTDPADNSNGGGPADADPVGSVSALVASGLPLESGLRALSEEAPSLRLRRTLLRMSNELSAGQSPEEVLSKDDGGLPRYVRGLVRSGIHTGELGRFLEEFLLVYRRRRSARRAFWMAMAYPLFVLPLAIFATACMLYYIVPQFKTIFEDFGIQLPGITMGLIWLGDLLSIPVLMGLLLLVILLPLIGQAMPFLFGRATWTRWIQRLPVIGTPSRMRGMAEFCSFLGMLVCGGIPLGEALEITSGALQDPNLQAGCRKLATRVSGGDTLQEGAWQLSNFSKELWSLFHWENRGATFGEILRHAGEVFAARSQVQLGMVGLVFQPLLLLFIGGFLGFSVIALFMPLIKLLSQLS